MPLRYRLILLLMLVNLYPAPFTLAQTSEGPKNVGMIKIPDPRGFIDTYGKENVQDVLRRKVEAGKRYFIVVATRGTGYVIEISPDENVLARRKEIGKAAERIKSAAKSPVISSEYKELVQGIERRLEEEEPGNVTFNPITLGASSLTPTPQGAEKATVDSNSSSPPDVNAKPPNEITPTPVWKSVLGRTIVIGVIGVVVLVILGCALWWGFDHWRRQFAVDSLNNGSGPDRSNSGCSPTADDDSPKRRRRTSTARDTYPMRDSSRNERRRRRRGIGRNIGLLLALVFLGLSLRVAHAQPPSELVAFDVSGSDYERAIIDARAWVDQAVSKGKTVRVVAFGDSAWVVAESIDTQAEADSILNDKNFSPQSSTRLADALRFVENQIQRLRSRGVEPHVRIATDFNSEDASNEALRYMQFPSDSTALPPDTTSTRDSDSVQEQHAGAWWWAGTGAGAGLLLGVLVAMLGRRQNAEDDPHPDDRAVVIVSEEGPHDYTWREITQRGSLFAQEEDLVLGACEEDGKPIVLVGLEGIDPLEEKTENSRRTANDNRKRRRREHRPRR